MAADPTIISFSCKACGQPFAVPIIFAGRNATCSKCGKTIVVPDQSAPVMSAPAKKSAITKNPLDDENEAPASGDSLEFEYGDNGTIYYAEPPRDSNDSLFADDADSDTAPSEKEGVLDFAGRTPDRAGAPDVPLHMAQADQMLRRALAWQIEKRKTMVEERQNLARQKQLIEAQLQAAEDDRARQAGLAGARREKWRRLRMWGLGALVAIYIGFAWFGRLGDWIVLSPTRDPILVLNETHRQIPASDGGVIEMWSVRSIALKPGEDPDAFVLAFPGNDQRAETASSMALDRFIGKKVEVWSFNYPGFGGSSGTARLDSMEPAAKVAYTLVLKRAERFNNEKRVVEFKPIYLTGQNIGAALAMSIATERRQVDGLVLYDPAPLRSLMLKRYGWFNLWLVAGPIAYQMPDALDAFKAAAALKVPAVFIIAGNDSLIPESYQRAIADGYGGEQHSVIAPNDSHDGLSSGRAAGDDIDWLFARVAENRRKAEGAAPTTAPATTMPATTQSAK